MARRSKSRQVAIQMLFQVDLNPDMEIDSTREMIADRLKDVELRTFAWELYTGVMEYRGELDDQIQQVAENWKISRMAATDRSVLRLGAYELLKTETPYGVVIDEAVELAKKFGNAQSSQFVNGILDKLVPPERRSNDRNS